MHFCGRRRILLLGVNMKHFLSKKLVLLLIGIVAILQIIHLVLLNQLEARHVIANHTPQVIQTQQSKEIGNNQQIELIQPIVSVDDDASPQNNEVEEELLDLTTAIEMNWILDASGHYHISSLQLNPGVVPALDVTLVTQCSLDHLSNLLLLFQLWQGPISVAVFAPRVHFWAALNEFARIRVCHPTLQPNLTLSFVWPVEPSGGLPPRPSQTSVPCDVKTAPFQQNYNHQEPYPNNLLRNTARKAATSDFVFVVDIDMLPSSGLREDFLNMAKQHGLLQGDRRDEKTVFVVPAFEGDVMPLSKQVLIHSVEEGRIRPFYSQLCWKCQAHTDYDTWLHEPLSQVMAPLYDVLWKDPWEPFYISRNSIPTYDERFKQYGFNRISQVCELHVAGYKFSVLNNAFVVHKGFKKQDSFHSSKTEEQEKNRLLFRQFKVDLKSKYPESSRRCY